MNLRHLHLLLLPLNLLLGGCSGLLYYPSQALLYDPVKTIQVKPEDVWLKTADGIKISGWYFRHTSKGDPKALLVFYHGNGENMSSHYLSLAWILPYGYDFFIFDYRGYGRSEGAPSPEGTHLDGMAALEWAKERAGKIPLVVFAQSLGGAVALKNLIEWKRKEGSLPSRYIVIDSSFPSYRQVGRKALARSPLTWLFQWLPYLVLSDEYAPGEDVRELSPAPLLVTHGDKDKVVDYSMGEELFSLLKEPKEFWKIDGGEHTDLFSRHGDKYRTEFLKRLEYFTGGKGSKP